MTPVDVLKVHKRNLEQVIAENAFVCTTNEARRWLRHVNTYLAQPHRHDEVAVVFGANQHGPALEQLYRDAAYHRSAWSQPVEEAVRVGRAA